MNNVWTRRVGWGLSLLLVVFLIGVSAVGKFTEWEGKEAMFAKFGYTTDLMARIGVVEVVLALLLLVPRAGFLAAVLLTGYLGGATATHVRVGDPFYMPPVIGVLVWVAVGLRTPGVFRLAAGLPAAPGGEAGNAARPG